MAEPQESRQVEEQKAMAEPTESRQEEAEQKDMTEPPESRQTEAQESREEEEGECMGEPQQQEEQKDMAEAQECNIMKEHEDLAGEPQQQIEEQKDTDRMHTRTNLSKKRAREEASTDDGTGAVNETSRWPGWPGYNVFRLLVPARKVGVIIGHRGDTIQNIRAETRSRIKIIDGGLATHNCSERVAMVSAKEEPDEPISPAMDGILRVHKLLIDHPQDLDQVACGDTQQAVTRMLLAGESQFLNIIGKQGATIRDIQEKSGVEQIRVLTDAQDIPHECALPDDKLLQIKGEPAKVHEALALVVSHLRKFLLDPSIVPLFESNIMSRLADQLTTTYTQMEHQHQPYWSRNDYNQTTTGTGASGSGQSSSSSQIINQYSTITCPPRHGAGPGPYYDPQISALQELPPLETQWREAPGHGDQFIAMPSNPSLAPGHGDQFTAVPSNPSLAPPVSDEYHHLQLQFPIAYADVVIGQNGEYIRYFRSTSGAIINVEVTRGMPGEMTIDIRGSNAQVNRAEQLIRDAISAADSASSGAAAVEEYVPRSIDTHNAGHGTGGYDDYTNDSHRH